MRQITIVVFVGWESAVGGGFYRNRVNIFILIFDFHQAFPSHYTKDMLWVSLYWRFCCVVWVKRKILIRFSNSIYGLKRKTLMVTSKEFFALLVLPIINTGQLNSYIDSTL